MTSAASPAVIDRALLQNLPTGRSLTAVMNLAPGVTDNVAFGGTVNSNGLTLDGVSLVEPVLGRPWVSVHYNWLDAVQVVALGAPAEYGQSTGATANGVLRSGGNRLSGLGEYVAAVPAWTGDNTRALVEQLQQQLPARQPLSWWDANGQVGGPLQRDRLWYFTGLSVSRERYRPFGYVGSEAAERHEPQAVLKLDAAPAGNVRAQGFYQYTSGRVTGEGLAEYALSLETAGERRQRNHTWHARGTWLARSDTTLEGRIGGYTGYSSFSRLKHVPIDFLKIDQSFVREIGRTPADDVIITTMVGLARSLGVRIIAEGVETEAQRRFLADLGCEYAQGYLWSRPLDPAAADAHVIAAV